MAGAIQTKLGNGSHYINLRGPEGNAFMLIGLANNWASQCLFEKEKIKQMNDELTSGNYEHLIQTFAKYWGSVSTLFREEDEYEGELEAQQWETDDEESEDEE